MSSVRQLQNMLGSNGPTQYAVRVKIVALGKITSYNINNEERQLITFSICDSSASAKAVCFDKEKFNYIREGNAVVLRNVIIKNNKEVVLTKNSRIFMSTVPAIDQRIENEAYGIIHPVSPQVVTISEAKKSPEKIRLSVRGKVVSDGLPTMVTVGTKEVPIRVITVEDNSDTISMSLWRSQSETKLSLGDFVEVTHVVPKKYQNDITLSSTSFTEIKVTEAPKEEEQIVIIGINNLEENTEVITDDGKIFQINNDLIDQELSLTSDQLPKEVTVIVQGGNIIDVK